MKRLVEDIATWLSIRFSLEQLIIYLMVLCFMLGMLVGDVVTA